MEKYLITTKTRVVITLLVVTIEKKVWGYENKGIRCWEGDKGEWMKL